MESAPLNEDVSLEVTDGQGSRYRLPYRIIYTQQIDLHIGIGLYDGASHGSPELRRIWIGMKASYAGDWR